MSRNIHEPTPDRAISQNRFSGKVTHQRPQASRWVQPDCNDGTDDCPDWSPALEATFAQPVNLEPWAFRNNMAGDLQFKGALDASGAASGDVAVVLPGLIPGEVIFVPAGGQSYPTFVTLDDATTLPATAQVDEATGDVTITWGGAFVPATLRALNDYGTGKVIGSGVETPLTFTDWENEDTDVFGETLSSGELQKVSFKAQGIYTTTVTLIWETSFDAAVAVWILDDCTTTGNWPFGQTGNMSQWGNAADSDSFDYPLTASITRKYPLYTMAAGNVSGGIYGQHFIKCTQKSGTNKDLTAVMMDIFYWGPTRTSI